MDKVLTTILLIIASVVCVVMVLNAVYPATNISSSALSSVSASLSDRIRSQATIIHVAGELDSSGAWQDTNSDGDFDIFIWVKNVGTTTIINVENSDIFIGSQGEWDSVPHEDYAGGSLPSWDYTIENGADEWGQTGTIQIEVSYSSPQQSGEYRTKIIVPNGVSDDYYFSM